MKRVILTESQMGLIVETMLFESSIFEVESYDELKQIVRRAVAKGIIITSALLASISSFYKLNSKQTEELNNIVNKTEQTVSYREGDSRDIDSTHNSFVVQSSDYKEENRWKLVATDVEATVYNAVPGQCDNDCLHTASSFRLDLNNVAPHKIIAMERTFMKELGVQYGDVVKIEGAGKYDGVYQIQDTMNKRFAGQHKIDILVPKNIKYGKWNDVKLYILKNKDFNTYYKKDMKPSMPKIKTNKRK